MTVSRIALLGFAAIVGFSSLVGTSRQASALDLSFLNHMNPQYTGCISNVTSQLAPQYRNDSKIHDSVVNACNHAHPAFGRG